MSDEKTYVQLKEEATALGLTFRGNISYGDLAELIEKHYEDEAAESKVEVIDESSTKDDQNTELPSKLLHKVNQVHGNKNKELALKALVAKAKQEAFKKRVVTISSNDTRDNQHVTAVPLFFENQYFALDRIVPLNVPVELEQCLIDIAKATTISIHKQEQNGNNIGRTIYAKKFNISYEDVK